jgi:hypothetical protein
LTDGRRENRTHGAVLRATDAGYQAARQGRHKLYQHYPEAIVFCRNTSDVDPLNVFNFEQSLPPSIFGPDINHSAHT